VDGWVRDWLAPAAQAAGALALIAQEPPVGIDVARAARRVRESAAGVLAEAGLPELVELVVQVPMESASPLPRPRPRAATQGARRPAPEAPRRSEPAPVAGNGGDTYDYVGIVMAKSAEGDAVASILARRDDVEGHEQPSFWYIRANDQP